MGEMANSFQHESLIHIKKVEDHSHTPNCNSVYLGISHLTCSGVIA